MREDSAGAETGFLVGHQVGDIARRIYDPENRGELLDVEALGFEVAFARSVELLATSRQAVFEAGFRAGGALAFADAMLPEPNRNATDERPAWRMVEVKSSTSVKDYHRDDVAVQAFVARSSGVALNSVTLAHIDSSWVYQGGGDYRGLLKEVDLTAEARIELRHAGGRQRRGRSC